MEGEVIYEYTRDQPEIFNLPIQMLARKSSDLDMVWESQLLPRQKPILEAKVKSLQMH